MKYFIPIRSTLLLCLLLLASSSVLAYDFQVDELYYTINGNEVTVSKSDYIKDLVIPKNVSYNGKTYSVTDIGERAFEYHSEIMTVSMPNTIKSIGAYGFYYCSAVTAFSIPNSVKTLGDYALSGCDKMVNLTIGSGVTSIGTDAFSNCNALTVVKIPDSVTSMGECTFWYCQNLTEAIIGNGLTTIPVAAFRGCAKLTKVKIGESVTYIDSSAFGECESLTEVNLPNSLTSIGGTAFYGCSSLSHIDIPNSVVDIGDKAFYQCASLTGIAIPAGVTSIGYSAFEGCSSLAEVYSYILNPNAVQMQWSTFLGVPTSTSVLYVPKGKINVYKEHGEWGVFTHIVEMKGGLKGDVNGDQEVTVADVNAVINIILGGNGNTVAADVNGDQEVTIADVNMIINIILGGSAPHPSEIETITVNGVSFNMVKVEGGTFAMGATPEQGSEARDNEKPVHQVTLSSFSIGETEVTQALWAAVMGSNPSNFPFDMNRPVEMVSWDNCHLFITTLNQLTGRNFRLPTEAEWEFAARGGKQSKNCMFAGGNNIDEVAWYRGNWVTTNSTDPNYGEQPVGKKKANELGLYDMSGNVSELVQDWYGDYSDDAQTNPSGPASGNYVVLRGGSWSLEETKCRVSYRSYISTSGKNGSIGLRLAL